MTASLGSALLVLAFLALASAAVAALLGRNRPARGRTFRRHATESATPASEAPAERWVLASRRAVYAACGLLTACVVLIEIAFLSDDFSFNIVHHSSPLTSFDQSSRTG